MTATSILPRVHAAAALTALATSPALADKRGGHHGGGHHHGGGGYGGYGGYTPPAYVPPPAPPPTVYVPPVTPYVPPYVPSTKEIIGAAIIAAIVAAITSHSDHAGSIKSSDDRASDAVEACISDVQDRYSVTVEAVEGASRQSSGLRIKGILTGGRSFSCIVDGAGRVIETSIE